MEVLKAVKESTTGKYAANSSLYCFDFGLVCGEKLLALNILIAYLLGADAGLHDNDHGQLGVEELGVGLVGIGFLDDLLNLSAR